MAQNAWHMMLENLFTSLGMGAKEARVYLSLLEIGIAKASQIVKSTGLKRGITYVVLEALEKQGFVSKVQRGGTAHFCPASPQKLIESVEERKKLIGNLDSNLQDIYPKLNSLYKLAVGKPNIQYFEGEAGLRKVFDDVYGHKDDTVYGCGDVETIEKTFPNFMNRDLIPRRIANKLFAQSIHTLSAKAKELQKNDQAHFRQSKLIDKDKYPMPAEIEIYGDKIAMMSFARGDFVGVIIENAEIVQSLKSVMRLAYDGLLSKEPGKKQTV